MRAMETGWVIVHPDGRVEVDYFHHKGRWDDKGVQVSRDAWMSAYRPGCQIVRATLTYDPAAAKGDH